VLNALYEALPDKLWLTRFQESGGRASISGIGVNEETVALFMKNLEASDYFDAIELKVTKQIVQDQIKFQQFDLSCKINTVKSDKKG
jgi:type IV pilus assembly protein PilN